MPAADFLRPRFTADEAERLVTQALNDAADQAGSDADESKDAGDTRDMVFMNGVATGYRKSIEVVRRALTDTEQTDG